MKFKTVFMLLIGTISFTAMASTPLPDENQKSDLLKTEEVVSLTITPVDSLEFNAYEVNAFTKVVHYSATPLMTEIQVKTFTSVLDVGWHSTVTFLSFKDHDYLIQNEKVFKTQLKNYQKQKIPIRNC